MTSPSAPWTTVERKILKEFREACSTSTSCKEVLSSLRHKVISRRITHGHIPGYMMRKATQCLITTRSPSDLVICWTFSNSTAHKVHCNPIIHIWYKIENATFLDVIQDIRNHCRRLRADRRLILDSLVVQWPMRCLPFDFLRWIRMKILWLARSSTDTLPVDTQEILVNFTNYPVYSYSRSLHLF